MIHKHFLFNLYFKNYNISHSFGKFLKVLETWHSCEINFKTMRKGLYSLTFMRWELKIVFGDCHDFHYTEILITLVFVINLFHKIVLVFFTTQKELRLQLHSKLLSVFHWAQIKVKSHLHIKNNEYQCCKKTGYFFGQFFLFAFSKKLSSNCFADFTAYSNKQTNRKV